MWRHGEIWMRGWMTGACEASNTRDAMAPRFSVSRSDEPRRRVSRSDGDSALAAATSRSDDAPRHEACTASSQL